MELFLLDTHVWFWLVEEDRHKLKPNQIQQLSKWRQERRLFLSHISIWEIANLHALNRLQLTLPLDEWLGLSFKDEYLSMMPIDSSILVESTRLPGEIHRDPGDRMIVATARQHSLTLLTRDERLLDYSTEGYLRAKKI